MDEALTVGGAGTGAAAPLLYAIPGTGELILKAGFARLDGTAAGAAWLPCMRIKTPNGSVMLECVGTSVAAGASADVTWFPGVTGPTATSTGNGLQYGGTGNTYGSDNKGDWLVFETSTNFDSPPAAFGLANTLSSGDSLANYSMGVNTGLGMVMVAAGPSITQYVLTLENFPTGTNSPARVLFAESQATGTGLAEGVVAVADGVSGTAHGLAGAAGLTGGANDAISVRAAQASHTGTGREIGLYVQNAGNQTGAKSLCILCLDHSANPIFEVRDDGSVHIKTGTSIIADL